MVPCLIAVPGYLVHEHLRAFLWPGVGHARWGAVHPLALLLVLTGKHVTGVTR